jgi:hypothetical protein
VKDVPKTKKEIRQEKEKELFKKGEPIPQPTEAEMRQEKNEIAPYITFTITDEKGAPVRNIRKSASKGINRVNWDLRYQGIWGFNAGDKYDPMADNGSGVLAMPGKYSVTLSLTAHDTTKILAGPVPFTATILENVSLPAEDRPAMTAFYKKVSELTRVMRGTENFTQDLRERNNSVMEALNNTPGASPDLMARAMSVRSQLDELLNVKFNRRTNKPSDEENPPAPVSLNDRLGKMTWASWASTSSPTQTQQDAYKILEDEFPPVYDQVKKLGEEVISLENALEKIGGPVTPGRLPEWHR